MPSAGADAKQQPAAGPRDAETVRTLVERARPEMISVSCGRFVMGCAEARCMPDEGPLRSVTLPSFRLGKYEVTFDQYDAFAEATGRSKPADGGWGRGTRPVINVSWSDARAFAAWLSESTGERFRLPTEAEWEYAARAGTTTAYPWGDAIGAALANCDGCGSRWDGDRTAPVGSFAANAFGLHDMNGNVYEWTEDCWNDTYRDAPSDGSAWTSGDCRWRVIRSGSWDLNAFGVRSAHRGRYQQAVQSTDAGFRLAQGP